MRWLRWALPGMMALAIVRLWLMPLPSSFWVDETGTMFVVRMGAHHPSFAIAPQVPASLYYWLPRMMDRWASGRWLEIAYRLPSVMVMLASLYVVARLAARWIHPQAGWLAAFACLGLKGFNYEAADARPYALGTLVAALSLWFLTRWLDEARWRDALLFVVCATLLWRVHLIYWPFYLVFAIYACVRVAGKDTQVRWVQAAGVFAVLGMALLPTAWQALGLLRDAKSHVIVPAPHWRELRYELKFGLILDLGIGAGVLRACVRKTLRKALNVGPERAMAWSSTAVVMAWWLVQILALFAFSRATGNSVFVGRYLSIALPGAALTATMTAALFLPESAWRMSAALLGVGVLVFFGQWREAWPVHHDSDWRGAAQAINGLGADMPVICPSPYIEAKWPAWRPDYPLPGFLYSYLSTYPIRGKAELFPYVESVEADRFAERLAGGDLARAGHFVIYAGAGNARLWAKWFSARPEMQGWTYRDLGEFGDVRAVLFARPG